MRLVFGALGDPVAQQFFILVGQWLAGFRRRHQVVLVAGGDAGEQLAPGRFAGNHRRVAVEIGHYSFACVEPETGLAMIGIRPVAGEAVVGEDRADIAVKLNLTGFRQPGGEDDRKQQEKLGLFLGNHAEHSRAGDRAKKSGRCHTSA